ncbi:MAG: hypothetical protein KGR16_06000 [Verrucomicrobia bacterium]|nr:hypothetical protein [Verrucomicrobiota bacterium]MDE3047007.1 hypothetical protein [Verrucomicrobiota bacterium]
MSVTGINTAGTGSDWFNSLDQATRETATEAVKPILAEAEKDLSPTYLQAYTDTVNQYNECEPQKIYNLLHRIISVTIAWKTATPLQSDIEPRVREWLLLNKEVELGNERLNKIGPVVKKTLTYLSSFQLHLPQQMIEVKRWGLNMELIASRVTDIKAAQDILDKLDKSLDTLKQDLSTAREGLKKKLDDDAYHFYGNPLTNRCPADRLVDELKAKEPTLVERHTAIRDYSVQPT